MADGSQQWYYVGDDRKPVGPMSLEDMLDAWIHGRINARTYCAPHGADGWTKVGQTPPLDRFAQRIAEKNLVSYRCKCGNRIIMAAAHSGSLARCKNCSTVFLVPDPPGRDEEPASPSNWPSEAEA
jgi:hypothetical protein